MSFEDLKRDLVTISYFDILEEDKKELIHSLVEKQFLSHLNKIICNNSNVQNDLLKDILKLRYEVLIN